jgi:hypothetical protein
MRPRPRSSGPFDEFGFLETNRGRAIYFHRNRVLDSTYSSLAVRSRVTFAEEAGEEGARPTRPKGGAANASSEPDRRPRRSPKTGSHFLARINAPCLRITSTAASANPANSQGRIALSDTKWSLTFDAAVDCLTKHAHTEAQVVTGPGLLARQTEGRSSL